MRARKGLGVLFQVALEGKPNSAMAAKGGFAHLSEAQVKAAFDHMMVQSGITSALPLPVSSSMAPLPSSSALGKSAASPLPDSNPLALNQHVAELLRSALGQPQNQIETYEDVVTLRGVGIKISNAQGHITLAGAVEKSEWVQQAQDIAAQVPGVRGVTNRLVAAALLDWD
jgi:hypothetical protein